MRGLALLGCLVATAGFVPAARAQQDAAAPSPDAAASAPAEPGAGGWLNWRGAPVSTSGSVAYDFRASHAQSEGRTLQQLLTASFGAASYLYQPWLATLSGTLGVTLGRSQISANGEATQDRFLTGSARIDLFPRSRFPADIHYQVSDSRIDSALSSPVDFRATTIGLTQRYRPASGAYSLSGSFDHREQDGSGFRDTQNAWIGDFNTAWKHNDVSLALAQNRSNRQTSDESSLFRSVVARHNYAPGSELSVNTTVNWSQTDEHTLGFDSDVSVLQWSSVGLWRREGSALTLNAGVRGLALREAESDNKLDSLGVTLGGSYELNRNARFTANSSVNTVLSGGKRSQSVVGSVGASWQSDTIEIRGLRYDWYANATLGGSHAGSDREVSTALQLGHTIGRVWPVDEGTSFALTAGQGLSATRSASRHEEFDAEPTSSRLLLHTAAATWTASGGNRNAYARASFSDSRELGGTHSQFQLLNFQISGSFEFDRNRSLTGDLTLQRVRQRTGDVVPTTFDLVLRPGERLGSDVASGEITYREQRLFGVPRLRFISRLKLARDVLQQSGTLATIPDRETQLWENRIEWVVGRLESQLILRISQFDGVRREFLMWRVQRAFGG